MSDLIKEKELFVKYPELLDLLLLDKTTNKNLIWATDLYTNKSFHDYVKAKDVFDGLIVPRSQKNLYDRRIRQKANAEVFTPSWICNKQNNIIDNAWFNKKNIFNKEGGCTWITTKEKILFPKNKTWQEYVKEKRIEITCGEGPYIVSRYDSISGDEISINNRIGILDRKLRIVNENSKDKIEWINWATICIKSVYGYDWQGDNVFLTRENILYTFFEYYFERFKSNPDIKCLKNISEIISWNIWQMDGLKFTVPCSCHSKTVTDITLFGEETHVEHCIGCMKNDIFKHNGIYCKIMDWDVNKPIKFINLYKEKIYG